MTWTVFTYTEADITGAGLSLDMPALELSARALEAGYQTPVGATEDDGAAKKWELRITDVSPPTAAAALTACAAAAYTPVAADASSVNVTADGVATGVINFTGPPNHTIKFRWAGTLPVSAAQITLDGNGDGSITFGPTTQITGADGVDVMASPDPCVSSPLLLNVVFS